jgi:hypothetical protein
MVQVASSRRSCGDEVEDERVNVTGCIRLLYPNFVVFFVLGHEVGLFTSFSYKYDPKGWWRGKHSAIPLPPFSYSCFLRGVGVLHGVREVRR